ncbi:putative toxin [Campylobacter sp. LH-2024]|uniref:putative toxin n=1 Tax=Campylobacter sp. LH-2024 TaxID=3239825 RepID=UPI003B7D90B7
MNEGIKIDFAKVNFHIKEFQKVYILENCKLCFYSPFHLQTQNGKEVKKIEKKGKSKIYLIDEDGKTVDIDKTSEQNKINTKAREEEKSKNVLFSNDEKGNDAINAYFDKKNIDTLNKAYQEREKAKPLSRNTDNFKDYDIFYDVYTSKDNKDKSLNKELGCGDGFEVKNGMAEVKAEFFNQCFEKGIYVLIPRLVSLDKNEELHFDPVPLEDKGFVVTDFRKGKKGEKNIDLTFQRSIAKIENPNLALQSPKEFLQALNENKEFTKDDKIQQAQAIKKACGKKADEMTKIILKDDKSLKDIITDEKELKKKIGKLQKIPNKSTKELSLLGRLEFLQRNQDKAKDYKKTIKDLQNPQQASNDKQNDKTKSRTKNKQKQTTTPNQEEQKNKNINSKDIGDAGEYAASMLFTKRSTRYLSNRRKLDANFNTKSFNHTIPDFLVTLNDYPTLVEVKNVQDQALTEQISFELKLAREYELDYLFLCNHYTKLVENIAGGNVTVENENEIKLKEIQNHNGKKKKGYETNTKNLTKFDEQYDWGSRRGFIYHRHFHRSIKTVFKEMYLHHIKGVAPNKIIIKRLNLNNSANIEEELNKNKQIQKN